MPLEMSHNNDNDDIVERSFLQRYGFILGMGVLVVLGVVVFAGRNLFSSHGAPPRKAQEIFMIKLPPPPPPPPPQPKPPEQKIEQKMIEQAPVDKEEPKPDEKPKDEPPPVSTNIKGDGKSDGFGGLSSSGGNGLIGGRSGSGSGSRWGWYASQVQTRIADALRKNPRTHNAGFSVQIRVWPDSTGRIARAQLVGSTGDTAVDDAITNEALNGLQLQEPPPPNMPMPIVLRLTARRPN